MKINKLTTSIASAAVVLSAFAPAAFASDSAVIAGNGSWSRNSIREDTTNSMIVSQSNDMTTQNNVGISNNTGSNSVNGNTNGTTSLQTGDATALVHIMNTGGTNVADLGSACGCASHDTTAMISGNGSGSDNSINTTSDKLSWLNQQSVNDFNSTVGISNQTGNNSVSNNTGRSDFWSNFQNGFPTWMTNTWWKDHGGTDASWNDFMKAHHFNSNGNDGMSEGKTGDANSQVMIHNSGSSNVY